jgi:pimeloyl-ACP methyl ester carboxylesterase
MEPPAMPAVHSIFRSPEGEAAFRATYDANLARWPVPYQASFVPTRFGRTHVIASGAVEAPPLVLLHGMGFSGTMWASNVEALSRTHRVYALDTPGDFGRSEVACPIQSPEECVQWLSGVLDGLGLGQVDLMGLSYGGWLAALYALRVPTRVRRLVLLAPAGGLLPLRKQFFLRMLPGMVLRSRPLLEGAWRWFHAPGNLENPLATAQFVEGFRSCRFLLRAVPGIFSDAELRSLSTPTLLLAGEHEVIYDARAAIARAARLLPRLEHVLVPRASHVLNEEQADAVNAHVTHFLGEPGDAALVREEGVARSGAPLTLQDSSSPVPESRC